MTDRRHVVINLAEPNDEPPRKLSFNARRRIRESEKALNTLLKSRFIKDEIGPNKQKVGEFSDFVESKAAESSPECDWWDDELHESLVTHLVEHPVPLKGTTALVLHAPGKKEAMLTPAERMKLRKLKRRENLRDMQDKVKMGLLKPPPPKIKMKNLMLVLGKEAVSGPSVIEQTVKAQVAQRLQDHQDRNEARKLTPELRRLKNISKWTNGVDSSLKLEICVYLIFKKVHAKNNFKISKNAQQLHLGGFFIQSFIPTVEASSASFYPSLVVVEGSHKAVKRFDRLMLHRIDWKESSVENNADAPEEDIDMEDNSDEGDDQTCKRIFKGIDSAKKFVKWSFISARDISSVHKFLDERECMHFWESLLRYRDTRLDI